MFDSRPAIRRVTSLIASLVRRDSGQDLIEYALLTAIVGVSGILVLSVMSTTMANAYTGWNTGAQNIAQPCPPQPAACP
jgi:Flp pilus assembly pilin Flp